MLKLDLYSSTINLDTIHVIFAHSKVTVKSEHLFEFIQSCNEIKK